MAYKSRKRLRQKCFWGEAAQVAATLAAAAMTTAATVKASKEQANAMKANADAQAKAQTDAAKVQSEALAQQNENNNKNVAEQINTQKELQESQNDIMKEMNLNLAIQAGKQNAEQREEQAKIQVKCGGSLRGKRLAGGLTLQDSNYVVPVGQGLVLLRGGSPTHPQDQTHSNSHKNIISGRYNKGSYLKVGNKEIEAEAGGNRTTGEIIDPSNKFVYSQRRFLPDGTSPVEKILAGYPKDEVALEQELTKKLLGIKNNGNKAMYGKRYMSTGGSCRRPRFDYAGDVYRSQRNLQNYYASLPGSTILPNSDFSFADRVSVVPAIPEPTNNGTIAGLNVPISSNTNNKGSWWSRQSPATQSAIIGAATNLGGTLISSLGNGIASGYMRRANNYANDVLTNARNQTLQTYIDAYNKMGGIDADKLIKENDFKAEVGPVAVRAAQYNISPQLTGAERTLFRTYKNVDSNVNSAIARQKLKSDAETTATDIKDKAYSEQTNIKEKINQANLQTVNDFTIEEAKIVNKAKENLSALRVDVDKYNNDIKNFKAQGIADATADALMGNAQGTAQTRINNAGLRANFATSTLSGIGNVLANSGKTYYDTDMSYRNMQNQYQIAAATSSNPNIMGSIAMQNPRNYDDQTLKLIYNLSSNDNVRKKLAGELSRRGVRLS